MYVASVCFCACSIQRGVASVHFRLSAFPKADTYLSSLPRGEGVPLPSASQRTIIDPRQSMSFALRRFSAMRWRAHTHAHIHMYVHMFIFSFFNSSTSPRQHREKHCWWKELENCGNYTRKTPLIKCNLRQSKTKTRQHEICPSIACTLHFIPATLALTPYALEEFSGSGLLSAHLMQLKDDYLHSNMHFYGHHTCACMCVCVCATVCGLAFYNSFMFTHFQEIRHYGDVLPLHNNAQERKYFGY